MHVTVRLEGINLEKLLREASAEGILLRSIRRVGAREMIVCVRTQDAGQLQALCRRCGWLYTPIRPGLMLTAARFAKRRPMFLPGVALCVLLVWLSSQMILSVQVLGAQEYTAEVERFVREQGVYPGRFKSAHSLDALRTSLAYRLPGLKFAAFRYAGSTLVCDCHPATDAERLDVSGTGMDIVAAQSGIVTKLYVVSGTPQVEPGQAVHKGQVLIAGYERSEKGAQVAVKAQGQVTARVYASGEAKVSLKETRTVETGQTRMRVTLRSPWHARVVQDAKPYASQDASRELQRVVGLYLPLWREKVTYAQTEVFPQERSRADAASMAQGAAEKIAREQCPPRALILDKIVNYSMIDDEFVYASVVLEYEAQIAGRVQ